MISLNKYMFVAYTGHASRANTGPWRPILPGSWSTLRFQIESFGLDALEKEALTGRLYTSYNGRPISNIIVRAYEVFKPLRLYTKDRNTWPKSLQQVFEGPLELTNEMHATNHFLPNTFLLLVRCPMPLGGRPYIPIKETSKYALMQHHLENDPKNESMQSSLMNLALEAQNKNHAADMELCQQECGGLVYDYVKAPNDYLCTECDAFGHHFKDACWIFEKADKRVFKSKSFGAKKFGSAKDTNDKDTTYYSLLHKRKTRN
jgi:hypothetical protein